MILNGVRNHPQPIWRITMNPILILSIAHYPERSGASWQGIREHEESVKWVNFIYSRLSKYTDITTHLVGIGKLGDKVAQVNKLVDQTRIMRAIVPILAVELHFNSAGPTFVIGNETLYYPGSVIGKNAAMQFNDEFTDYASSQFGLHIKDRGAKPGWYRMDRPGIKDYEGDVEGDETPDYFLRKTKCTSLILEPHFMCELESMVHWTQSAISIAEALRATVKCLTSQLN